MDHVNRNVRHKIMAAVKSKNTSPELRFRQALWRTGCRYRIHQRDVPGSPDISHKGAKVAVFIDGCFWHGCPKHYRLPKSNESFWSNKIKKNKERRVKIKSALLYENWLVVELWECQITKDPTEEAKRVADLIQHRNANE